MEKISLPLFSSVKNLWICIPIKHLHLICFIAKIWTIEYSIEIFNVLVFVVLVNPIAGNGVVLEKFYFYCKRIRDFPGGSDVKRLPTMWETWVRKILRRRKWQPTPVLLPGKSHGWKSLVGYSPGGRTESDTTKRLHLTKSIFLMQILYNIFIKYL